jgi:signal transduction histidine kinase
MLGQILLIITFISNVLLLSLVAKESKDRYFKTMFFGYIITTSLWSLLLSVIILFPAQATLLGKLRMIFVCWAPYFLILAIHALFNKPVPTPRALYWSLLPLSMTYAIVFTPLLVKDYVVDPRLATPVLVNKGTAAPLFFVYHLLAIIYQFFIVSKEYFTARYTGRALAVKIIFYAVVGSYCLGVFLAIILPLFFRHNASINFSPLASIALGFGLSYSIWRYQLFKIRLFLRESLIIAIGLAFFTLSLTLLLSLLRLDPLRNNQLLPWTMFIAVLLSQFFQPQIKALVYHIFNKDKYVFEEALRYIYRSFGHILERPVFEKKVTALLAKIFKPLDQAVLIFAEPRNGTKYTRPEVYYEDDWTYPADYAQGTYDLALSLVFDQKLLGFLFLTLNKKYLNYTLENLELLKIFARQVSIALANTFSYEELQQQQQRLFQTEKIALLGQLTAGIVHELRNPLTALTMTVSNMKQCLDEAHYDPQIIERLWRSGQNSIQEMKQFLENMRTFSRTDNCILVPTKLHPLVEETLPLIRKKASEQQITIKHSVPPELELNCNPQQLKQVLLNLLLNGIEAMPNGGCLELTIQNENAEQIIITVADTGVGIPEAQHSKIFLPFYTTKKEGTGLGLVIVKEIVEAHHGSIALRNKHIGTGCEFKLSLPKNI